MPLRRLFSAVVESAPYMSVSFIWLTVLFKSSVSLMIFCLAVLSKIKSGVLKLQTTTVELSISPQNSVSFCVIYFEGLLLGAYIFIIVVFPWWIDAFIIIKCFTWFLVTIFSHKSVFLDISIATLALFWLQFAWHMLLHPFIVKSFMFLKP